MVVRHNHLPTRRLNRRTCLYCRLHGNVFAEDDGAGELQASQQRPGDNDDSEKRIDLNVGDTAFAEVRHEADDVGQR
eukprot:4612249-Pyramimonas_sp.AAC.1